MEENLIARNDLLYACYHGDDEFLRHLVMDHRNEKDFAVTDDYGWTPLHLAVCSNSFECVKILLSTKLLCIDSKTNSYNTCLDLAVWRDISCDIIQLLIENDPNFSLIRSDLCPLQAAVEKNSLEMVKTIVGTLEQMHFSFDNLFECLFEAIALLRFQTDAEKSNSIEIFEILIGACIGTASNVDFMQRLSDVMLQCEFETMDLYKWCIERYHLSEKNKHRDLVLKLLNNPDFGFDDYLIFALHSDIDHLIATESPYNFYQKLILRLLHVNITDRDVIAEVMSVLWPKIDLLELNTVFYFTIFANLENHEIFGRMTSVKWLDAIQIGTKIEIAFMPVENFWEFKIILNALMPFSTQITADAYLPCLKKQFESIKSEAVRKIEEHRNGWTDTSDSDVEFLEQNYLDADEGLQQIENDDDLAKFCTESFYRVKSSLETLCRAEIRRCLLYENGHKITYSELVAKIQRLELPKCLKEFLLFNYSDHHFFVV